MITLHDFFNLSAAEKALIIELDLSCESLGIQSSEKQNAFCQQLLQCPLLTNLNLRANQLDQYSLKTWGTLCSVLGQLNVLTSLDLSFNAFSRFSDQHWQSFFQALTQCKMLRSLNLSGNDFDQLPLEHWSSFITTISQQGMITEVDYDQSRSREERIQKLNALLAENRAKMPAIVMEPIIDNAPVVNHVPPVLKLERSILPLIQSVKPVTAKPMKLLCQKSKAVQDPVISNVLIPEIPFSDLTLGDFLGAGTFGLVYVAHLKNGKQVAVKKLRRDMSITTLSEFTKELFTHVQLNHANIVQLEGVCLSGEYALVIEFMQGGSLHSRLHDMHQVLPWKTRLRIALHCATGLLYLHERNVIHRDLKSLNVLLNEHGHAKLSDFGLAKIKHDAAALVSGTGTPYWNAPELFSGADCSEMTDVYSMGMIFWEIVSRKSPYKQYNTKSEFHWREDLLNGMRETIPKKTTGPQNNVPPKYSQLITACWKGRAEQRPKTAQIVDEIQRLSAVCSKN